MGRPPEESADATESGSETASTGRSTRHNLWALAAVLLGVGGVAGSAFTAESVARNDAEAARQEAQLLAPRRPTTSSSSSA